jgi:hypothetical protein
VKSSAITPRHPSVPNLTLTSGGGDPCRLDKTFTLCFQQVTQLPNRQRVD